MIRTLGMLLLLALSLYMCVDGVDRLECWAKGAEYMSARGAVCR